MSQHDYTVDDASGAVVRADINAALQALASNNAGTSAPGTTYAGMWWIDTTNTVVKRRNAGNSAWIVRDRTDAEGLVAKSSGFTVALADFGKVFRCTSALTIAIAAVSGLPDGFWFGVINASSGAVVIDPNSSEQIDGAATKSLPAGFSCHVHTDGSLFRTLGVPPDAVGDSGSGGSRGLVPAAGSGDAAAFKFLAADMTYKRAVSVAILEDQKSDGTDGGTSTSGSDQTAVINTEVYDPDSIVSVASNQFTLGAGKYRLRGAKVFNGSGGAARIWFYDTTNTTAYPKSVSGGQTGADAQDFEVETEVYVSLSGSTVFELRYRVSIGVASTGLGRHDGLTIGVETYARVVIEKIG